MKISTFINNLTSAFIKEESLKPYRQAPFSDQEWNAPYQQEKPPFLGGKPKSQPVSFPSTAPSVPSSSLSPSVSLKNKSHNPMQYLALYISKFNSILNDLSSNNEVSDYQVKDEFFDFVTNLESSISPMDQERESKLKAIEMLKFKFQEVFESYRSNNSSMNNSSKVEGYKDLSKEDIRALIIHNSKLVKSTKGSKIQNAIDLVGQMPEIRTNDNNFALWNELKQELQGSLDPSDLTDDDRKDLYDTFMFNYLNDASAKTPQEKKIIERRYRNILNQKLDYNIDSDDVDNNQDEDETVDVFSFLQNELFQPDIKNKELFLSFFLEKEMHGILMETLGDQIFPEEIEILNSGVGKYQANSMAILQRHASVLKEELKNIMRNKSSQLHEMFFNWVLKEIKRFGRRQTSKELQERGDAVEMDEKAKDSFFTLQPDRPFGTDFRMPIPKDVFEQEGLTKEGPPLRTGDTIDLQTFESLKNNWQKMDGFISDVLRKMEEQYNAIADRDIKINILQKSILWARIRESCSNSVSSILQGAQKGGNKPLTDPRVLRILNQDWSELFKQEFWGDFDWSLMDPSVNKAAKKAVDDKLAQTPEQALSLLFGDTSRDNKNWSNLLQQKADAGINNFKNILLSPDLINKYGPDTLISFIEILNFNKIAASVGSLLAKSNRGSFDDKIDYLTNLSRRGVIENSEDEIENMSPQEVMSLFDRIRHIIEMIYAPTSMAKTMLGDPNNTKITDQYVSQLAQQAGIRGINNKSDYSKSKQSVKSAILEQFYKSEYGKYFIDQFPAIEAFKAFLKKQIQQSSTNSSFLSSNGFSNSKEFMAHLGFSKGQSFDDFIENMPQRRLFQISSKYYPKLYQAYNNGVLQKTLINKDKVDVSAIVDELLSKPSVEKTPPARSWLTEALFFADILDGRTEAKAAASQKIHLLQKIAMQKRLNNLLYLKNKFLNLNVDTTIVEDFIERLGNVG